MNYNKINAQPPNNTQPTKDEVTNNKDEKKIGFATVKKPYTLNVREEPNLDSSVITTISMDTEVKVHEVLDAWLYVSLDDDTFGYVMKKYLKLDYNFK